MATLKPIRMQMGSGVALLPVDRRFANLKRCRFRVLIVDDDRSFRETASALGLGTTAG